MERTSSDEIEGFLDELLESLMSTPDDELLAEAIEDHGSIAAAIAGIGDEINLAINSLAKDRLRATQTPQAKPTLSGVRLDESRKSKAVSKAPEP